LDLPETLKSQLKKYQDWYDVQRLKAGTAWAENRGHLFVNLDTGKAVNPKTLSDWLSAVTNEAGLGHWNLHSMRHTNVSYKIQRGVPLAEVSADAGHSNLTVTTTIYAHDIGKGNRQAPKIFDMMMTELGKKEQNQQEEDYQLHKAVGANIYPF
jgi:integrase